MRTADWDVDGVRDDLRGYVLGGLGDAGGVWVGLMRLGYPKGSCAAGMAWQYTGMPGTNIDYCQLGVFLAYASPCGRVLVDGERGRTHRRYDEPSRRRQHTDCCAYRRPWRGRGYGNYGRHVRNHGDDGYAVTEANDAGAV